MHWQRWRRHGDPLYTTRTPPRPRGETCEIDGCEKPQKALGWCAMHYARWSEYGDTELPVREPSAKVPCSIGGCDQPSDCRGWCNMHYLRWRNHGDPMVT